MDSGSDCNRSSSTAVGNVGMANLKINLVGTAAIQVNEGTRQIRRLKSGQGMEGYCVESFVEAPEVNSYTLVENTGLNPISVVKELRNSMPRVKLMRGLT